MENIMRLSNVDPQPAEIAGPGGRLDPYSNYNNNNGITARTPPTVSSRRASRAVPLVSGASQEVPQQPTLAPLQTATLSPLSPYAGPAALDRTYTRPSTDVKQQLGQPPMAQMPPRPGSNAHHKERKPREEMRHGPFHSMNPDMDTDIGVRHWDHDLCAWHGCVGCECFCH